MAEFEYHEGEVVITRCSSIQILAYPALLTLDRDMASKY
jgi:hypothetical protein